MTLAALTTVLITAIGLSMDAVAVSIAAGLSATRVGWRQAALMAATFGFFQAVMPAIGWALGSLGRQWIAAWDHWIAFALLAAIGGKMVWDALHPDADDDAPGSDPFALRRLLLLGVATSIDALAVGVGFSLVEIPLLATVTIIGVTTAALCLPAVLLGRRLGERFAHRAGLIGGLVLIAIGVKLLLDGLLA